MGDNNKFEDFDSNRNIKGKNCDSEKIKEEKSTTIKSNDNKESDDNNNKDNKDNKEKNKIPFLEDISIQTDPSNLDDDEYFDENNYDEHSYTNKKREREGNDDE